MQFRCTLLFFLRMIDIQYCVHLKCTTSCTLHLGGILPLERMSKVIFIFGNTVICVSLVFLLNKYLSQHETALLSWMYPRQIKAGIVPGQLINRGRGRMKAKLYNDSLSLYLLSVVSDSEWAAEMYDCLTLWGLQGGTIFLVSLIPESLSMASHAGPVHALVEWASNREYLPININIWARFGCHNLRGFYWNLIKLMQENFKTLLNIL